jgi:transcriptional regulator with AAA-type ATPase domain
MHLEVIDSIDMALVRFRGNQTEAADHLGMNRGTLRKFIDKGWEFYVLADGSHFRQCKNKE